MFTFKLAGSEVIFSKFQDLSDSDAILGTLPEGTQQIALVDTPATLALVTLIATLLDRGIAVHVRDNHDCATPANPEQAKLSSTITQIRTLCGRHALISDQATYPACSLLINSGEFSDEKIVIIASLNPAGLISAMKAIGLTYGELDSDVAILEGPLTEQTTERLSHNAFLLALAFNSAGATISESDMAFLFSNFVSSIQGNASARARLQKNASVQKDTLSEAECASC